MLCILDAWSVESFFAICALLGGAVLSLQLVLLLFGFDADADLDVDGADGFGFVSIRALASFIATFGLVGWWASNEGYTTASSAFFGLLGGLIMMGLVGWLFSLHGKLHQDGTVVTKGAVGQTGTVYLRIPGENSGKGKITVTVQGRPHEFVATTPGPELPTGTEVHVVRQVTENTFEVKGLNA